jgi:hypothetical protein
MVGREGRVMAVGSGRSVTKEDIFKGCLSVCVDGRVRGKGSFDTSSSPTDKQKQEGSRGTPATSTSTCSGPALPC